MRIWIYTAFILLVPVQAEVSYAENRERQSNADLQITPLERSRDGQADFDFSFGEWNVSLSRLLNPLTGSTRWVDYEGTAIVTKIWGGHANLVELDVSGPNGRIQGASPRLYNPQTREWRIHWVNSSDGRLDDALVGGFDASGRGEFYNQETLNGRAILVRIVFSDITKNSFQLEQAFSADGGKTWEPNWIATFSR